MCTATRSQISTSEQKIRRFKGTIFFPSGSRQTQVIIHFFIEQKKLVHWRRNWNSYPINAAASFCYIYYFTSMSSSSKMIIKERWTSSCFKIITCIEKKESIFPILDEFNIYLTLLYTCLTYEPWNGTKKININYHIILRYPIRLIAWHSVLTLPIIWTPITGGKILIICSTTIYTKSSN